jgi:hypothetical protein
MENEPAGAISQEERRLLCQLYYIKKSPDGYYCVDSGGNLSVNGNYAFTSPPPAYYFTNYFFAWAYHLRLKKELKNEGQ